MSLTYDMVKLAAPDIIKGVGFGSQNGEGERRTIMELKLNFITPVWTADATGKMHHVEATGLIGSLRWWYEVLIRGVGGWACGATDGTQCELDAKVYKARREAGVNEQQALADAGLCPACRLFGATNWAKMFSLHISNDQTEPNARPFGLSRNSVQSKQGSRYYFPKGYQGQTTLIVYPRQPNDENTLSLIAGLFDFIQHNAALGAKTNLNYGVFRWNEQPKELPSPVEFAKLVAQQAAVKFDVSRRNTGVWPNLQDMFLAEADAEWSAEEFVNFKDKLRKTFRDGPRITNMISNQEQRDNLRHFLLGSTDTDPSEASKIKMTVADNRLRIWGWVPRQWDGGKFGVVTQGKIKHILFGAMQKGVQKFHLRDVKQFKGKDTIEFLRWMMEGNR